MLGDHSSHCPPLQVAEAAKGRLPGPDRIKKLILGILQSSTFLSYNAFGFVWGHCFVRSGHGSFEKYFVSSYIQVSAWIFKLLEPGLPAWLALQLPLHLG